MTELQAFRNELSNYKFYKKKLDEIEESIEDMRYKLFGVHGVDPSKVTIENKNYDAIDYERLIKLEKFQEFVNEQTEEINRIGKQLMHIHSILAKMDKTTRQVFVCIYVNKMSYPETCLKIGLIDQDGKPKTGELQYIMTKAFKN